MAERDEEQYEIQRDPLVSPRPKAPIISGLSERGARSVHPVKLTLPTVIESGIKEVVSHDARPSVLAQLDLHKRTILKSETIGVSDGDTAEPTNGVTASSTSEPPPNLGQTLPLPEALRAVAQASLSPFAFEATEHFEWDKVDADAEAPLPDAAGGTDARADDAHAAAAGQDSPPSAVRSIPLNERSALSGRGPELQGRATQRDRWARGVFVLGAALLLALAAVILLNQKRLSAERQADLAVREAKLASSRLLEQLNGERARNSAGDEERRLQQERAFEAMRQADRAQVEVEYVTKIVELQGQLEAAVRKRRAIEAERDQAERDSWTAQVKRKQNEAEIVRLKARLEKASQSNVNSGTEP